MPAYALFEESKSVAVGKDMFESSYNSCIMFLREIICLLFSHN